MMLVAVVLVPAVIAFLLFATIQIGFSFSEVLSAYLCFHGLLSGKLLVPATCLRGGHSYS